MFGTAVKCFALYAVVVIAFSHSVQSLGWEGIIQGSRNRPVKYLISVENQTQQICAGAILGPKFALTAASCVINVTTNEFIDGPLKIVAANNNVGRRNVDPITVDVERALVPSVFNTSAGSQDGNIALLKFKQPLRLFFNMRLEKLSLPKKFFFGDYQNYLDQWAKIVGFSSNNTGSVAKSKTAYKINALVVDNGKCQNSTNSTVPLNSTQICTSINETEDIPVQACENNIGSPLVYFNAVAIGVLTGCDENGVPKVYTRVSSYVDFINNARNNNVGGIRQKVYS